MLNSVVNSYILVVCIPDEIISDNSSQFVAKQYHTFAPRNEFKLIKSSQHYSRGYNCIERQVLTICVEDG